MGLTCIYVPSGDEGEGAEGRDEAKAEPTKSEVEPETAESLL